TEPIAPQAAAAPAVPVAPPAPPKPAVRVTRKWLVVGSGVGAVVCLGLGFGAGYVVADQTGGHHGRYERGERGEHMRQRMQQWPGGDFGPGRHWQMMPPGSQNGSGQVPQTQVPQNPQNQVPQNQAPQTQVPGTSSG
ncbi:hypothetical protein, partial [Gordonia sp. (in: high G+C Gram-positive bacteria)]|uniref:hypothetical protein n=1 Tax=Gordonia sp. (in: high G+C Gram-positive bacteria) TaxID=84139 RepID=UPI003C76DA03